LQTSIVPGNPASRDSAKLQCRPLPGDNRKVLIFQSPAHEAAQ